MSEIATSPDLGAPRAKKRVVKPAPDESVDPIDPTTSGVTVASKQPSAATRKRGEVPEPTVQLNVRINTVTRNLLQNIVNSSDGDNPRTLRDAVEQAVQEYADARGIAS